MSDKKYVIKCETIIHFKTGQSLTGDLSEFLLVDGPGAMKIFLEDPEVMKQLEQREMAIINLNEVVFIDVKYPRVLVEDSDQ